MTRAIIVFRAPHLLLVPVLVDGWAITAVQVSSQMHN